MAEQNDTSEQPLSLRTLCTMRSLLLHPSTPQHTVSSILETLARSPSHHALKLLSDAAALRPDLALSPPLLPSPQRLAVEALAISLTRLNLDDTRFASLCFGASVPVRAWMLRNAGAEFEVRHGLLLGVLLGFTKDPFPHVRASALEGLVGFCERGGESKDVGLVDACYRRAVRLLRDVDPSVRFSAVRVVASWGLMLAASNSDMKAYWSNDIFAKLCSMARDMNMKVRVEAFSGLRKMEMVSEDLLLQSLSKRVSGHGKQKETLGQRTSEQFVMLATNVAGALVHGLEDEFFEVRKSVCESLRTLTSLSSEFARKALDSLMDVLNDESEVVRLQSLETLHHMAINGRLKLLEKHLHMFLGALVDNSWDVRYTDRKILKVVKLNYLALFKSSVDSLLGSLDSYPQDEADVFSTFSHLGRNHKKFVSLIIKDMFEEVESALEGNVEFNSARIAALDALLACLCEKSRSTEYSATNINPGEGEQQFPLFEGDAPNFASNEVIGSKIDSHITREQKEVANDQVEQQQSVYNEVTNLINYILAKLPDMWPRIQSGHTNEVLRSLRCLKELTTMKFDSLGSGDADALAFTLLYLRIIELLAEVWNNLLPAKGLCYQGIGKLEFKLGKLDRRVKELMSRFIGFSAEEELNVLELMLLTYTLRISKEEISCINHTLKRLSSLYLRVESILKESSALPSNFLVELGKVLSSTSINGASCSPLQFEACLKFFSLKQFVFHGPIKHVKAELSVPNIDFEHPLPFVSGLPVGIQCEITLHNILSESRLWLRMTLDDGFIQYFFLDLDCSEGSEEVRKCTFVAPFYRTAEADCLILKVCIGSECLFENVSPVQKFGGPKRELVLLCNEKQVYLSKSLISDSSFVKLHLQRSPKSEDFLLICSVDDTLNRFFILSCPAIPLVSDDPLSLIADDHSLGLELNDTYEIAGACNGLSDTYKVVSIVSTLNNDGSLKLCEVKVCNINGHNCWRNIQSFHADPTSIPGCGVYLNSTLNWMALAFPHNSYDITFDELVIVSLDLRNETYTQLLLPRALDGVHLHDFYSDGDDEDFISDQCFGVLKDCLSLFLHSRKTKHLAI
ncbi:Protein SIEL [Glycine soja]